MSAPRRAAERLPRWLVGAALFALLSLGVALAADSMYHPQRFAVRAIYVHGEFRQVAAAQVREVVQQSLSGNYFSVDLAHIEQRVAAVPGVGHASVRRRWPDALVVEITEVQPLARWGNNHWVIADGVLAPRRAAIHSTLPLLAGPMAESVMVWRTYRLWSVLFAAHGLRLQRLELDAHDVWHAEFSAATAPVAAAPVTLAVARSEAGRHVAEFVAVLQRHLMPDLPAMRSVDLRYPNGFAIGWGAPQSSADTLSDTFGASSSW